MVCDVRVEVLMSLFLKVFQNIKQCYWVNGSQHFEDPLFLLNIWTHLSNHSNVSQKTLIFMVYDDSLLDSDSRLSSHPHDEGASDFEVDQGI
jgi:hypothetical protein